MVAPLAVGEREAAAWYWKLMGRLKGVRGVAPLPPERAKALTAAVEAVIKSGASGSASDS